MHWVIPSGSVEETGFSMRVGRRSPFRALYQLTFLILDSIYWSIGKYHGATKRTQQG